MDFFYESENFQENIEHMTAVLCFILQIHNVLFVVIVVHFAGSVLETISGKMYGNWLYAECDNEMTNNDNQRTITNFNENY